MDDWKDVYGYEGMYQVSRDGLVRSLITNKVLARCEYQPRRFCVSLHKDGKGKTARIHRLVASAFIGEIPEGMDVNHINGDSGDNRASNLEIVTHSQNVIHRYYVLKQQVREVLATNARSGEQTLFGSIKQARRNGFSYKSIVRSHETGLPTRSGFYLSII